MMTHEETRQLNRYMEWSDELRFALYETTGAGLRKVRAVIEQMDERLSGPGSLPVHESFILGILHKAINCDTNMTWPMVYNAQVRLTELIGHIQETEGIE